MKNLMLCVVLLGLFGCSDKPKDTKSEIAIQKRIKDINIDENLKMLQKVSKSDYGTRIKIYTNLLKYDSNNTEYKKELAYNTKMFNKQLKTLTNKIEKIKSKKTENYNNAVAKFGKPPKQNSFDGSYDIIKQHVMQRAKDKDSISFVNCTKPFIGDKGWLIACDYKGKNSYGTIVENFNWFTIKKRSIVKIENINTYKIP